MKSSFLFFTFLSTLLIIGNCSKNKSIKGDMPDSTTADSTSFRIMSYNIKYDDKADTVNGWNQRKEQIVNLIRFYEPGFLGTQEGLLHQLQYIQERIPGMKWIGVGRDDGAKKGEFSALFYDSTRFRLIPDSDSTLWLSQTPSEPSKSWDAALPRILTWGRFQNKKSGKTFFVFNTHFDHIGDTARAESSRLIVETIDRVAGDAPVILTGDFNATEDSEPYAVLSAASSGLYDAYNRTERPHVGPQFSYSGFEVLGPEEERRIDYIFVNDRINVKKHAIISDFRDGRYPSDHLPVIADVKFK